VSAKAEREALVAAARAVRRHAHAPYSKFTVGAAVRDERGRIHVGCNVENASYGLTVCAERNAVAAAVAAGARRIRAVAVASGARPPATPCGACRQVIAELGGADTEVFIGGATGAARKTTLRALLPQAFGLSTT
jgi:cytidine deaminase